MSHRTTRGRGVFRLHRHACSTGNSNMQYHLLMRFTGADWSCGGVPTADDILRRMADDPAFASLVETNPADALRGIELSRADLARIEQAVREISDGRCRESSA